jgi:hypothetical protein
VVPFEVTSVHRIAELDALESPHATTVAFPSHATLRPTPLEKYAEFEDTALLHFCSSCLADRRIVLAPHTSTPTAYHRPSRPQKHTAFVGPGVWYALPAVGILFHLMLSPDANAPLLAFDN